MHDFNAYWLIVKNSLDILIAVSNTIYIFIMAILMFYEYNLSIIDKANRIDENYAVKSGTIVGYQGRGKGRPIYEFIYKGKTRRVAISIGSNGYIVGANPKSI